MNRSVRRLALVVLAMFLLLAANATYVQLVLGPKHSSDQANPRNLVTRYAVQRGPIIAAGATLALSRRTDSLLAYQRHYPTGSLYTDVVGYDSLVYGTSGLEQALDAQLSGAGGGTLSQQLTGHLPPGDTARLTLLPRAQLAAAEALGSRRGAVVALDPRTGAILAMVTSPTFDANPLVSPSAAVAQAAYRRLLATPYSPLLNRAINATYPPGSLFKIVTSAAALSTGNYTAQTVIPAPTVLPLPQTSHVLTNFGGESCGGQATLIYAFTISCNTAFAGLGMKLGPDALAAQAAAFGIGKPLSIPLAVSPSVFPTGLNPPETAFSAIGQYNVALTPLQAAMIGAGVADQGTVMTPYLVSSIRTSAGALVDQAQPHALSQAVTPAVAAELTQMMISVVNNGTGTAAQIPGVQVAGKTGTAQHGVGAPPHAWFVAFAPAAAPTVAVAVVVEDGGNLGSDATGGIVAAPIAKAVITAVLAG